MFNLELSAREVEKNLKALIRRIKLNGGELYFADENGFTVKIPENVRIVFFTVLGGVDDD